MKKTVLGFTFCVVLALAACGPAKTKSASGSDATPLTTRNIEAVKGQKATCAGPSVKTFNID